MLVFMSILKVDFVLTSSVKCMVKNKEQQMYQEFLPALKNAAFGF